MNAPGAQRLEISVSMSLTILSGIWLVGVLGLVPLPVAATVANDACTNAIALVNGVQYTMDTTFANSDETNTIACNPDTGNGVWFTFTPPSSGPVTVTTVGSSFAPVLQIYSGSCASLTPIICNAGDGPVSYRLCASAIFSGAPATTYRILVLGRRPYPGGPPDYGTLVVQATTTAPNDSCTNATALTAGFPCTITTTNANSSGDPVPSCQASFGKGVWFTYYNSVAGQISVSTFGSTFDTVLQVYSGSCGALTQVACNDNNGPLQSGTNASLTFSAAGATTYYILAGGAGSKSGNLLLSLNLVPPNDTCSNAVTLSLNTPYSMSTLGATTTADPLPVCQPNVGRGVWFKFTPAQNGIYQLGTCGSGFDTVMQIYQGSCGSLSAVSCNDDSGSACAGTAASLNLPATAGVTYYVFVAGKAGAGGTLNMLVGAPVSNDECATATPLSPGVTVTEDTSGATWGGTQTSCQSNLGHDVWFTYSQAITGPVVFSTAGSLAGPGLQLDTVLQLYSGSCGALVPVACNDDANPDFYVLTSALTNTITANTTYYLQVGGYGNAAGTLQMLATSMSSLGWSANKTNITLTWSAGSTLQMATNLNTPAAWQDITTSGTYTERMTNKTRFFRLKN
jgi:hypothetical protein